MSERVENLITGQKKGKNIKDILRRIFFYIIIFLFFDIIQIFIVSAVRKEKTDTAGCPNSYYHHDLKALTITDASWGERNYKIITNSLGFKDSQCHQVPLSVPNKRILFIGDSFTEGIGINYDDTFVGRIGRQLKSINIEVLNAAVRGYSPKLYYLKTKFLIENLGLKFDELFVFIDLSDVQDEIVYENFVPSNSNFYVVKCELQKFFYLYTKKSLLRNIYRKIGLWEGKIMPEVFDAYYKERDIWPYDDFIYKKWGEKGLKLAEQNMDLLLKLCKDNNIKVAISIYPHPIDLQKAVANPKNRVFWSQYAQSRGIKLLDLFDTFQRAGTAKDVIQHYYIAEDAHWNQEGHRIVAETWLSHFYPEKSD